MDGEHFTKDGKPIYLRTAIQGDRESIENIDLKSHELLWDKKKFDSHKDATRVAIVDNRVIGFWVATNENDLDNEYINLLRLAVTPSYRRQGIGSILLKDILFNYNNLPCSTLVLEIEIEAQYFLAHHGFQYEKTLKTINVSGLGETSIYYFKRESDE